MCSLRSRRWSPRKRTSARSRSSSRRPSATSKSARRRSPTRARRRPATTSRRRKRSSRTMICAPSASRSTRSSAATRSNRSRWPRRSRSKACFGVESGQAQVKALEAAESSSQLALEATQLGYKVGVRVNLDVLNAQTQLFTTRRDLAKARYDVLVGSLKLRQAAGTLKPDDVLGVNQLLTKQQKTCRRRCDPR